MQGWREEHEEWLREHEIAVGHGIVEQLRPGRNYQPLNLFAPVPPIDWVVENIVVAGEATLLVADGGAGKSFFAMALSLAVTGGEPFLGNPVKPGRVMYVDEEGSPDLALQRLEQLGATAAQKRNLDYLNFVGVDLVRYPDKLIHDVQATSPVLVVIDSHAKVARMGEENSNNEMGRVWDDGFLKIARDTRAAVLVIHHTSAYGSSRGATQIRNSADQVLTMKKNDDGTQTVYASKPRRLTNSITFSFEDIGEGRYALIKVNRGLAT
jgi:RecA-family ATPase